MNVAVGKNKGITNDFSGFMARRKANQIAIYHLFSDAGDTV